MKLKLITKTISILSALLFCVTMNAQLTDTSYVFSPDSLSNEELSLEKEITFQIGDRFTVKELGEKYDFNPINLNFSSCSLLAYKDGAYIANKVGEETLDLIASDVIGYVLKSPIVRIIVKEDVQGTDVPVSFSPEFLEMQIGETSAIEVISHLRCCVGEIKKIGVEDKTVASAFIDKNNMIIVTALAEGATSLTATVEIGAGVYTLDAKIIVKPETNPIDVYLSSNPIELTQDEETDVFVYSMLDCGAEMDCVPTDIMAYVTADDGYEYKTYPAEVTAINGTKISIKGIIEGSATLVVEGLHMGEEFRLEAPVKVKSPIVGGVSLSTDFIELQPLTKADVFVSVPIFCENCQPTDFKAHIIDESGNKIAQITDIEENRITIEGLAQGTAILIVEGYWNDSFFSLEAKIEVTSPMVGGVSLSTDFVVLQPFTKADVFVSAPVWCESCQPTDFKAHIIDESGNKIAQITDIEENRITIEGLTEGTAILVVEGYWNDSFFSLEAKIEVIGESPYPAAFLSETSLKMEAGDLAEIIVHSNIKCFDKCEVLIDTVYTENPQVAGAYDVWNNTISIEAVSTGYTVLYVEGSVAGQKFALKAEIEVIGETPYPAAFLSETFHEMVAGDKAEIIVHSNIKCFGICEVLIDTVYTENPQVAGPYNVWNNTISIEAVSTGYTILYIEGSVAGQKFALKAEIVVKPHNPIDTLYLGLDPYEVYLEAGESGQFSVPMIEPYFMDSMLYDPIPPYMGIWNSSDPSIATVDVFGTVTAISPGKAEITLTYESGDFVNVYSGYVIVKHATGLIHTATIPVGHRISIEKAFPAIGDDCTFQVNTAGIISIDRSFNIYALRAGTVDLTAYNSWGEKVAVCRIYVEDYGIVYEEVNITKVWCEDDLVNIEFDSPVFIADQIDITIDIVKDQLKSIKGADVKSIYFTNNNTQMVIELARKLEADERIELSVADGIASTSGDNITFTIEAKGSQEAVLSVGSDAVKIDVYPNPAVNNLRVKAPFSIQTVSIFSIKGALVHTEDANGESASINVSNLPLGIYTLQLNGVNGEKTSQQFIKQ